MTREDIIRMARSAGCHDNGEEFRFIEFRYLERFAALVAAAEREKVAAWMMQRGYATGHGDTVEDLLEELDWQIAENWTNALVKGVEGEREACAKVCQSLAGQQWVTRKAALECSDAIRARGNT